jgi:pentose-5-phosphate-3-epimerase
LILEKEINNNLGIRMRPTVDIHYVQEHIEETNLAFILQKPRGVGSASLIEEVETYVKNPNFRKLYVKEEDILIDVVTSI